MVGVLLSSQQELWFHGAEHEVQGCYGIRRKEDVQIKFVLPVRRAELQSANGRLLEFARERQM